MDASKKISKKTEQEISESLLDYEKGKDFLEYDDVFKTSQKSDK